MSNFPHECKFVTDEPRLIVDSGLAIGTHVFELVVVDQAGNRSQPAIIRVEIIKTQPIG